MTQTTYDAIIVGARCAGATLATLLARTGASVLLLDRDRLPCDQPISTHTVHPAGMDVLDDVGVGAAVRRGLRPMHVLRLQKNAAFVDMPYREGRPEYCPRRGRLDRLLQEAAVQAGAELVDHTRVVALLHQNNRTVGVRVARDEQEQEFRGRLVIGADGRRSTIAKLAGAEEYLGYDAPRAAYWSYWDMPDIWQDRSKYPFDMYVAKCGADFRVVFQTDDDQLLIASAPTIQESRSWRHAPLEALTANLSADPVTGPLVAGRAPSEPVRGTVSERYFFRQAVGPGWVLIGDAGHHKDYVVGDGITEALLQARTLAAAIARQSDAALTLWWRERDVEAVPHFFFAQGEGSPSTPLPLECLVFEQVNRSDSLKRAMTKTVEHEGSPLDVFPVRQIAGWTLGAALRGRLGVIRDFLAMGRRASTIQREMQLRRQLADAARAAV
jgi:flavin-dependent dehydrogenase